jgi:exopolyphosphatase / guanosine-5'-triphosphate,3'-diphosphate pyrophosphatase
MKRLSAVDIGTNTILMLIADVDEAGALRVVRDEHVIARLGEGVDEHHRILPETFDRVLGFLSEYKRIHENEHSEHVVACGTSALRDAINRDEFITFIRERVGFGITVLSGDEEARLTYLGGISEFVGQESNHAYAVLDIGGGSTEVTFGQGKQIQSKHSIDVGSVRLTERHLRKSPPDPGVLAQAQNTVATTVQQIPRLPGDARWIGVAGTLTTLAAIDLDLQTYDRDRVSGHKLTLESIDGIFHRLKRMTLDQLKSVPQILPQRADILLGGVVILTEVMKRMDVRQITVSDRGLRYGILLNEAQRAL